MIANARARGHHPESDRVDRDGSRSRLQVLNAPSLHGAERPTVGSSCARNSIVHIESDDRGCQHVRYATDVIGVIVGSDRQIESVHMIGLENLGHSRSRRPGIDEHDPSSRRHDQSRVTLPYIEKMDLELLGGKSCRRRNYGEREEPTP